MKAIQINPLEAENSNSKKPRRSTSEELLKEARLYRDEIRLYRDIAKKSLDEFALLYAASVFRFWKKSRPDC